MQSEHRTINDCSLLTESFCFYVVNTRKTLFQWITPTVRRISGWIVSFLDGRSFKHSVGTDRIDKRTIRICDTIVSLLETLRGFDCKSRAMGKAVLPFDIWLYYWVISFYPTLASRCNALPKKGPKRIIQKKTVTDRRRRRFFYTFLYLLGSTTSSTWVREFSLNAIEMVESPS